MAASAFCLTAYLTILFFAAFLIAGIYAVFTPADAGVIERTEKQYDLQRQKYARSIEEVMRTTRYWIATNPDELTPALLDKWKDDIPLGDITGTGLHPSSVMPGIKARYCDSTLLVYLHDSNPKGIDGDNLRLIQTARVKAYIQRTRRNALGRPAPLQWLDAMGNIERSDSERSDSERSDSERSDSERSDSERSDSERSDSERSDSERSDSDLSPPQVPNCMKDQLPSSGRPALIDKVTYTAAQEGFDTSLVEYRTLSCRTREVEEDSTINSIHESRTGIRKYKRGSEEGAEVWEIWQEEYNFCPDYTEVTIKKEDCKRKPADLRAAKYQEDRIVTSGGTVGNATVNRVSTCPEARLRDKIPDLPPGLTGVNTRETKSSGCPSGYTGSVSLARTKTVRTTAFPRGQDPITTIFHSNWAQTANSCHLSTPLRYSGGGRDPADADGEGVDAAQDLDDHDPNITGRCCSESGSR